MASQVRCTGQLSGCERCEALDVQCTYFTEKGKRQRNLSDDEENSRHQHSRRQRRSWLSDDTGKPANHATPLSDANFYNESEDDGTFTADSEQWSSIFPGLTPDGAPTLNSNSTSATSGSAYVSTQSTSHGGTGTDVVFWNGNELPSTDLAAESNPPASETHHTIRQRQHHNRHDFPAEVQPHAQTHGQFRSQGETQALAHIREPEEPARGPCKCMKSILYLINELEMTLSNDSYVNAMSEIDNGVLLHKRQGLDSTLGLHKDAIRYGESMRQCQQCIDRAENRMLLLLLANRLIALCAHMVSDYRSLTQATSCKSGAHAWELAIVISMGEYEVESRAESSAVLRELLAFQLRSLHTFVTPLSSADQLQGAEFHVVKNRAAGLWRDLQQNSVLSPL